MITFFHFFPLLRVEYEKRVRRQALQFAEEIVQKQMLER